ncbi:MAG: DUF1844 domain-containing protein [Pseudomonadota bacterium]
MIDGNGFIMSDENPSSKEPLPKIDFSSFVLSLYSTALVQLGKVEDPSSGKKSVNLDIAKHTIDMIAMLEEKTQGNLNEEEQNLLKALLSEIRLAYVEAKT